MSINSHNISLSSYGSDTRRHYCCLLQLMGTRQHSYAFDTIKAEDTNAFCFIQISRHSKSALLANLDPLSAHPVQRKLWEF